MRELLARPRHYLPHGGRSLERRWLGLTGKALVSIGLLWLLSRDLPAAEFATSISGVRPIPVVVAGLLLLVVISLGGVRWLLVVASLGGSLPLATIIRLSFEGLFFSQALPSTIGGDAVRAFRASKLGLPPQDAVHGVILDRVIGLSGLVVLIAIGFPRLVARIPAFDGVGLAGLVIIGVGCAGALLGLRALPSRFRRSRLVAMSAALSEAAWRVVTTPFTAGVALLLSVMIHVLTVISVALLAAALSVPIGLADCFLVVPAALLAAAVPISIAGWGVREGAMVGGFALLGVADGTDALALSVLFGGMLVVASLPGGVLWLVVGTPEGARGSPPSP